MSAECCDLDVGDVVIGVSRQSSKAARQPSRRDVAGNIGANVSKCTISSADLRIAAPKLLEGRMPSPAGSVEVQ